MTTSRDRLRVMYFCEGFTDIRFVVGLSGITELTFVTPAREYRISGLADRIAASGASVKVVEIPGGRPAFQLRSFGYLLRNIAHYDVVLSQEMVRGSLSATIAGRLRGVPVVTYMGVAPLEYFMCRRERGQIGIVKAWAGGAFIRSAMTVNGALATAALGMGPYLRDMAARTSSCPLSGGYYGVDEQLFKPACDPCRPTLRRSHQLPEDKFIIFFSSRISHEKDPETLLRATAVVRDHGIDAVLMNLGGGYEDFLKLALELGLSDCEQWIIGRPAVHPMHDLCEYFQLADVVVQSSLEEGFGLSPLEGLACGTPVVATRVGGMAAHLDGYAQLTPRRDYQAMASAIQWVAEHRGAARAQAAKGREYVLANWTRAKVFNDLKTVLENAAATHPRRDRL